MGVKRIVESLVFSAQEPLSAKRIASVAGCRVNEVQRIVDALNADYERTNRSFRIRFYGGGYSFYTLPDFAHYIRGLLGDGDRLRLTPAAMEVLAIIAMAQPATVPYVNKVRGGKSEALVRRLMEMGLVTVRGRQSSPGRPILYGTTQKFLHLFGLERVEDIPTMKELEELFD